MDVHSKSFHSSSDLKVQIDNDSGYVSHNQESNSDSVIDHLIERMPATASSSNMEPVYFSEDTLFETPAIYNDNAEIVNSSVLSEQSNTPEKYSETMKMFRTLQDSTRSTVISIVSPIIIDSNVYSGYYDKNMSTSFVSDVTSTDLSEVSFSSHTKESSSEIEISVVPNEESNNFQPQSSPKEININKSKTTTSGMDLADSKNNADKLESHTPEKKDKSPEKNKSFSPDLFSDDEISDVKFPEVPKIQDEVISERFILKQDHKLIRRMQNSLCGVLPPPSITVINLSIEQMLQKIENNRLLFWDGKRDFENVESEENCSLNECSKNDDSLNLGGSLLISTTFENCLQKTWPNVLEDRYHGLHYNRSKYSEELEQLCMKYATRYVGAETQSSCTIFDTNVLSPTKRRLTNRLRWGTKSPGRRLSHLARRRITFSSANIQANNSSRQIMLDTRRLDLSLRRRSPRKTPRKSPRKSPRKKIRTPSSSTKKRLSLQLQMISEDRENKRGNVNSKLSSTKRALFQSPDHNRPSTSLSKPLFPSSSGNIGFSPFKKRPTPKCALFTSPMKSSPTKLTSKRKRVDSEEKNPAKLSRTVPEDRVKHAANRLQTDSVLSANSLYAGELSAHHKKKLQWAVYEALRAQNIGINHPQFKQFASVLAKVTRKFLPNLSANTPRPEGGTSERMLRIARHNVLAVIKGKSVEEILQDMQKSKLKQQKPNGYVSIGQTIGDDVSTARNKENVFKDKLNTMTTTESSSYLGLNRQELIKTTLTKTENRVDRVRKIINFDDNSSVPNSNIR